MYGLKMIVALNAREDEEMKRGRRMDARIKAYFKVKAARKKVTTCVIMFIIITVIAFMVR
jgi:t-SNARE complex subunit (syntaxin)